MPECEMNVSANDGLRGDREPVANADENQEFQLETQDLLDIIGIFKTKIEEMKTKQQELE